MGSARRKALDTVRGKEIEVKLRVADEKELLRRLRGQGARRLTRVHELNTLFDTRQWTFRKRGHLIRLRIETPLAGKPGEKPRLVRERSRAVLTYKGPSARATQYKMRDEVEVVTGDAQGLRVILSVLGLRPTFRYEKMRSSYALRGLGGLNVEVDETPIGFFVELEGPPRAIDRAARLLGYQPKDYITKSYLALYFDYCRAHGLPYRDMLFGRTRR